MDAEWRYAYLLFAWVTSYKTKKKKLNKYSLYPALCQ